MTGRDEALEAAVATVMAGGPEAVSRVRDLAAKLPDPLTPREREVLQAICDGERTREIARRLFLSTETIRTHVSHARRRLRAHTTTQAVCIAAARGEITLPDPFK